MHVPNMGTIMPSMGTKTERPRKKARAQDKPSGVTGQIACALFTATQQRVLGLLFGQPERSFYLSEIRNRTGTGTGALQRELGRLTDAGLATAWMIGNQRHYQANHRSPVHGELIGLIRKTVGAADPLRRALAALAQDIVLAVLYGSVAAGTDTASSDLDLLVVSDTLTLEVLYRALARAEKALGRKANPTLYTTAEFRRRRGAGQSFVNRVLAGDTVVLFGDPNAAGGAG